MKRPTSRPILSAQVQITLEERGTGRNRLLIRRGILVDRSTGLLHELPTVFVLRSLGKNPLNTQLTTLYDLAFYVEWARIKASRSKRWSTPENRIRSNRLALTHKEIDDLANWCQHAAKNISFAASHEEAGIRVLPLAGSSVEGATTNRRLQTICNYLCWLTRDMVEGALLLDDRQTAKSAIFQDSLQKSFDSSLNSAKTPAPLASLNRADADAFRKLVNVQATDHSGHGLRDNLIGRILLATGLRAGELLKIQCQDLDPNFEIEPGRFIAILKIIKRPNDINDERRLEPSSKTLPGPIVIGRTLAAEIIQYVVSERRAAVDRCCSRIETPYLFISHSGAQVGHPLSYSNLRRIVSKLRDASSVVASLTPHTLRHTHFTELRDLMFKKGADPKEALRILQERGHWSSKSSMPDHYSQRHLTERQAYFVEERDRILDKR